MKIISYSLWGSSSKYCLGAIKNAHLALDIYPGWISRFYIGKNTPQSYIDALKRIKYTEVVEMPEEGNWTGMFWRFKAADGDDIVISRDTDSRLSQREKDAVDDWLNSSFDFHIMRDHPYHRTEILGGMWGARNGILKGINKMIDDYVKGDFWQVDQNFLRECIYPIVKNNSCVHDEFFENKPFPSKRNKREFVGKAFNGDDTEFCSSHGDIL
jgi:protein O-GlcNAc transferase